MLYQQLEDQRRIRWSLRGCAFVTMLQSNYEQAQPLLEQSLALCRQSQDEWGVAWTIYDLGYLALAGGNLDEAQPLLEEALAKFHQREIMFGAFRALTALGDVVRTRAPQIPNSTTTELPCLKA